MVTEKNLFKEYAICSINELGDEKIRMAETTLCGFCFAPLCFGWQQSSYFTDRYTVLFLGSHSFTWSYAQCQLSKN